MQTDLERLRRLILDSSELQQQLDAHTDAWELADQAAALGASLGCSLEPAELRRAIFDDARWDEFALGPAPRGPGWFPGRLVASPAGPAVAWCRFTGSPSAESFYGEGVRAAMRRPLNRLLRLSTPLAEAVDPAAPALPLAGLIFHMSRCGSTLVSRGLEALPQARAICEPEPFDDALRLTAGGQPGDEQARINTLRTVVRLLGRYPGGERLLFLKLDSWHIFDIALIRRAFPGVPWIFVCRDPIEVLVSHRRRRGSQMVPGTIDPQIVGMSLEDTIREGFDAYAARVLERICAAAAAALAEGDGRLLRYEELPAALWGWLPAHFGLELGPGDAELMHLAALSDAKRPYLPFYADGAAKQAEADPALRMLADRTVRPAYEALLAAGL